MLAVAAIEEESPRRTSWGYVSTKCQCKPLGYVLQRNTHCRGATCGGVGVVASEVLNFGGASEGAKQNARTNAISHHISSGISLHQLLLLDQHDSDGAHDNPPWPRKSPSTGPFENAALRRELDGGNAERWSWAQYCGANILKSRPRRA